MLLDVFISVSGPNEQCHTLRTAPQGHLSNPNINFFLHRWALLQLMLTTDYKPYSCNSFSLTGINQLMSLNSNKKTATDTTVVPTCINTLIKPYAINNHFGQLQ